MNTVEMIKRICKERGIAISKLERECGFSNGYIAGIKKGTLRSDRLQKVADYLNVSYQYLSMAGEGRVDMFAGTSNAMTVTNEERELLELFRLLNSEGKIQLRRQLGYLLNDELFSLSVQKKRDVNSVS